MVESLAWAAFAAVLGPLAAAVALVLLALAGRASERLVLAVANAGALLGLAGALAALGAALGGVDRIAGPIWFTFADHQTTLDLAPTLPTAAFAVVTLALTAFTVRFAGRYLHRDPGLARFLALTTAFAAGTALVALAADPIVLFAGWELAGACSVLLIAFHPERIGARAGALRALITNKLGDAALVGGLALILIDGPSPLAAGLCCLAGAAKAGLVPAAPWVERAIEGPTPSSALFYGAAMTHAGLLLAARFWPMLEGHPGWTGSIAALGLLTAAYGFTAGRAQPDVKSRLVLLGIGHLGLAFALIALVHPTAGLAYGIAHMVLRFAAMLLAPAELQARQLVPRPRRPVPAALRRAARDRYGLEEWQHRLIARPITAIARAVTVADARAAIAPELPAFHPAPNDPPPATDRPHALHTFGRRVIRLIEALENHVFGGRLLAAADPDRHPRRARLQAQVEAIFAHPITLIVLAAALVLGLTLGRQ